MCSYSFSSPDHISPPQKKDNPKPQQTNPTHTVVLRDQTTTNQPNPTTGPDRGNQDSKVRPKGSPLEPTSVSTPTVK